VELTPTAVRLVDAGIAQHVANEQAMLAGLSDREQAQLDRLNRKLLAHLTARAAVPG
jgi:DNA-binding MarR family transcriptional regulator